MQPTDFFALLERYNTGRKKLHKLGRPLSDRDLNAWTKQHPEFVLPANYVELLRVANGFTLHPSPHGFALKVLPLKDVKWEPRHWFDEDTSEDESYPKTRLVVAIDDNGDWGIGLDTATGHYLLVAPNGPEPEEELGDLPRFLDWVVNQKLEALPAPATPAADGGPKRPKPTAKKSKPVLMAEHARFDGHRSGLTGVAVSPDGRYACSCGCGPYFDAALGEPVFLWDVRTGLAVRPLRDVRQANFLDVTFSPDGSTILAAANATIQKFDVATGAMLGRFRGNLGGYATQAYPNPLPGHEGLVWAEFGGSLLAAESYGGEGESIKFLPDGTRALSSSRDRLVRLWDTRSGQELRTYPGHKEFFFRVAVSPDGKRFASIGGDKTLRVRDVETGEDVGTFERLAYMPACVAFSPDGTVLVSGGYEKNGVQLWDVATQRKLAALPVGRTETFCVAFSPDGSRLLCGTGKLGIQLWDWKAGRELARFTGHVGMADMPVAVIGTAFVPGSNLAVSAGKDDKVRVFVLSE